MFWLNSFPSRDGASDTLSPRYLTTGVKLTYNCHVRLEFGSYVQTHEEHTNDMQPHTIGAIGLGLTGNAQGSHYFMSLGTGKLIRCIHWSPLPMPQEAITNVSNLGRRQGMPTTMTFADRHGDEIHDDADDVDDDHDSNYEPDDDASIESHHTIDSDAELTVATAGVNEGDDGTINDDNHGEVAEGDAGTIDDDNGGEVGEVADEEQETEEETAVAEDEEETTVTEDGTAVKTDTKDGTAVETVTKDDEDGGKHQDDVQMNKQPQHIPIPQGSQEWGEKKKN